MPAGEGKRRRRWHEQPPRQPGAPSSFGSALPRLEFSGRREEGGERLAGLLLWELVPAPPEDECLLVWEREEER